jgi:outer membrane lipoprotein carrier protein
MTPIRRLFVFALVSLPLLLCRSAPTVAADLAPLAVAQKIQEHYAQTKTMRAEFQQTTTSRMSARERLGAGSMLLAKPGLMRWDYREPDQQVFVCDGQKISMYFAKERQMMVTPAKDYLESPTPSSLARAISSATSWWPARMRKTSPSPPRPTSSS